MCLDTVKPYVKKVNEPVCLGTAKRCVKKVNEPLCLGTVKPCVKKMNEPLRLVIVKACVKKVNEPVCLDTVKPCVKKVNEPVCLDTVKPCMKKVNEPVCFDTVKPCMKKVNEPVCLDTVKPCVKKVNEPVCLGTVKLCVKKVNEPVCLVTVKPCVKKVNESLWLAMKPCVKKVNESLWLATVKPCVKKVNESLWLDTVKPCVKKVNEPVCLRTVKACVKKVSEPVCLATVKPCVKKVNEPLCLGTVKPCVKRTLALLTDLVESIAVEGVSISKKICYQSIQGHVQATLAIFPVYIHQPDVTDGILQFFLALFQGLRVQMGVPFTEQTIRTFMSMFSREQLKETINQESTTGYKVVEKFLKILEVIAMEPGQSFKALLPSIVNICMQEIYPIIAERASPDIKPGLYQLLHQLLHHNWRYFFKASVLTSFNSKSNEEQMEHEEQFISIMQAFGQSFLQPDIDVFRYNMEALENLNESKKLYSKKIVKEMMLGQFLNILIQVLIVKSHDLLCEEIAIVVNNMASVDFDGFYSNYLPQLLRNCDGIDDNQKATLAQNFKVDTLCGDGIALAGRPVME